MTAVRLMFLVYSKIGSGLDYQFSVYLGLVLTAVATVCFLC